MTVDTIALIQHLLAGHPDWHRTRLSRELCRRWGWASPTGQLKDMACRALLLKLERRGLIVLPPRQRASVNAFRNRSVPHVPHACAPIDGSLRELRPLTFTRVGKDAQQVSLFRCLVARYHYLGLHNTVGENMKYLIGDRQGRPVACLLFGSAAWTTAARDRFIGWDAQRRQRHLSHITNNTRFLILPWVRVPHLASHILSRVAKRINEDWMERYGHRIDLLETFVDRTRFEGTCYRAANWIHVGTTTGRTRNDRHGRARVARKDIYLYPLHRDFLTTLTQPGRGVAS